MKKFWEYYKKSHRLQDSTKIFIKKQGILEYDFLTDWIKKKEHQEVFSWKLINKNFRFKNIIEQLLVPDFIKRKKGFAVLGKIIRIVGTINLKRLKVHINPFLHIFPNLKLHSHITMELKGIGKYMPSQLNLYRPYKLSNMFPSNLEWHMSKASFALLYFKKISKKASWNQSAQIKYMFLRTALGRMYKIKEKTKNENKVYIFENIKKDLKLTENLFLYLISNIKKGFRLKKTTNAYSFFLENLSLVVVKPFLTLNNFLLKLFVAPKKKKKLKKKKKDEQTEIEIQKKLDLNKVDLTENNTYLHPSLMSTKSSWRRLKQTVNFGFKTNLGLKTRFDYIYEEKMLREVFLSKNSNLDLYINPSKKIERKFWLTPKKAFLNSWEFKIENWSSSDKKTKSFFWTKNILNFSLYVKKIWMKKKNFRVFPSPYKYMKSLRELNEKKMIDKYSQTKWNPNYVDNKFYKLIDFIYDRKAENHDFGDYKWKLKKLGRVHELKLNKQANINNNNIEKFTKLFANRKSLNALENFKKSFVLCLKNLPDIIKAKFKKFFNLSPFFANKQLKKKYKFRSKTKKGWTSYYNRFKKTSFSLKKLKKKKRDFIFSKKFVKLKNRLLTKSFVNEKIESKTIGKQVKHKKLSNLYDYINSSNDSLLINNNNKIRDFKKDFFIQKHIGLVLYKKSYTQLWKNYLRRWTTKLQMNNLALWLISFYKLLNEFFTVFFLWFYKEKHWTENINKEKCHKRSSNSYRTKYQLRNWYPFLQESIDFIKFDNKLPLVKDTSKYIFIENLENKDLIYKYVFYKMFFNLINLRKVRNLWLFDPLKKLWVLMIINFFRKILLIEAAFGIYKDFTTIYLTKVDVRESNLTAEEDLDLLFSLTNLRIFYKKIYINNFESKTKIWPINIPRNRVETLFTQNIFTFTNWKFSYLFKLRQLISSFRFKQNLCVLPFVSEIINRGYRNRQIKISNSLRYRKFQVSGYRKFSFYKVYKNRFVYSNLVFYDISNKSISDKTYLHNSHVFYNGYNTLSRKTFFKLKS